MNCNEPLRQRIHVNIPKATDEDKKLKPLQFVVGKFGLGHAQNHFCFHKSLFFPLENWKELKRNPQNDYCDFHHECQIVKIFNNATAAGGQAYFLFIIVEVRCIN